MDESAQSPIIQYWHSSEIPASVAELIRSVGTHNPRWRHLVFDRARAEELIAERFTPREASAFEACAVPAMQADYFRYCAIYALGGVYADADMRCDGSIDRVVAGEGGGKLFRRAVDVRVRPRPYPTVINHFFAFRSPGHPLMRLAVEIATTNVERRVAEDVWAVTGPGIFTGLLLLRDAESEQAFVERFGDDRGGIAAAESLCEVAGGVAGARTALAGVDIGLVRELSRSLQVVKDLPYKHTGTHWVRWEREGTSIFRARIA